MAKTCADSSMVELSLFQTIDSGSIPTSALQFTIEIIDVHTACRLNQLWHSRLPYIHWSNVVRNRHYVCYGARFNNDELYAVAIWSSPVASNRMKNANSILELRRFAIKNEAPKNSASRILSIMRKKIKIEIPEIKLLISYQDTESHMGTIYKADNWTSVRSNKAQSWTTDKRSRNLEQSTAIKVRWQYEQEKNIISESQGR
jgi:hypothetical protein